MTTKDCGSINKYFCWELLKAVQRVLVNAHPHLLQAWHLNGSVCDLAYCYFNYCRNMPNDSASVQLYIYIYIYMYILNLLKNIMSFWKKSVTLDPWSNEGEWYGIWCIRYNIEIQVGLYQLFDETEIVKIRKTSIIRWLGLLCWLKERGRERERDVGSKMTTKIEGKRKAVRHIIRWLNGVDRDLICLNGRVLTVRETDSYWGLGEDGSPL